MTTIRGRTNTYVTPPLFRVNERIEGSLGKTNPVGSRAEEKTKCFKCLSRRAVCRIAELKYYSDEQKCSYFSEG